MPNPAPKADSKKTPTTDAPDPPSQRIAQFVVELATINATLSAIQAVTNTKDRHRPQTIANRLTQELRALTTSRNRLNYLLKVDTVGELSRPITFGDYADQPFVKIDD